MNLEGETALVVGGTRNIGLAVANALYGAGAKVCVVGGSDSAALANALTELGDDDDKITGLVADITDEAAVNGAFEHAEQKLGAVSILVNGPGFRPHGPFMDTSLETWKAVLDVMLTGPFLTCREFFRRLPTDRLGAIVNIGGLSAHRPAKDRAPVIAAKAGIGVMVLNAARFLATDIVFLGIIVIGFIAFFFDSVMRKFESVLLPWKGKG